LITLADLDALKVFSLIVKFDWGTVDLGFYTRDQIQAFRNEFTGPQEDITVLDPTLFSEFIAV
jgi:hypothetical protein